MPPLLLIASVSLAAGEPARPLTDSPKLAALPDRWTQVMDLFDTPGMAVAVVDHGQVYAQGFGIRDPSGAPVTPETLFYIASITKTFTATTICALADDKRLSLDDPVRKYLQRLRLAEADLSEKLTLRDLLCHRYGIDSEPIVLLDAYTGEITEERYDHWLAQVEIAGTVQYTNVHFTLLGRVIEAVTGQPWREALGARVLVPAGMNRTTGSASKMYTDPNSALPLERVDGAWHPIAQRKTDRTMHAAGGLGTSALEASRWLRLHLEDGALDGKRILSQEMAQAMRVRQSKLAEPDGSIRIIDGYGLAWAVGEFNGHRLCQHGGGYVGTAAYVAVLPDDQVGVAVLVNASGPARRLCDIVAIEIMEKLTGTKSPYDIYEKSTSQAREMKQKAAAEAAAAPVLPSNPVLSKPATAYAGSYTNEWWGTLRIEAEGGRLAFQLGEMTLAVAPGKEGADHFVVENLAGEDTPGQFLAPSPGGIDRIQLLHPKLGTVVFQR